ncbi:hypothetical protein PAECIP111891_00787 [Paenibacillus allorhizoplanae]|uniref:DUF2164 domain-containing protein n=1 Tax=Paenibacillus allorhizoplanae TaxID=2905648 RepID=A0ABN8G6D1_9BACL|nr:DUF2164 family protein [Paenibacillus allorhizoplanae]CAH1196076.1 hypothetical protein PAECIP111891_00787 [Paenibacillus allorhizoplanae]
MKVLKLPKDEKDALISDLQEHLDVELGVTVGQIAAEQLIDYMLQQLTSPIYNLAIEDAIKSAKDRMTVLEDDLYALKVTKLTRR